MTGGLYTSATYGGLYSEGRFALERAQIPNAALDARVLLSHATRRSWEWLFGEEDQIASPGEIVAFAEAIETRLKRMPVAQITGRKEFWSLVFSVNASTLIPRPESEHVIERALELVPPDSTGRILDLGTGSGCLLIALLKERPGLTGVGIDRSFDALSIAHENARHLGVEARSAFVLGDWTNPIGGLFDLVISNPPYLSQAELEAAPPEVKEYEPHAALNGGADGLDAYRSIAASLRALLKPGGFAVFEIGAGQGEDVTRILRSVGLDSIRANRDLAGLPRVISARNVKENKGLGLLKKRLESAPQGANVSRGNDRPDGPMKRAEVNGPLGGCERQGRW